MFTFGQIPAYQGGVSYEAGLSSDKQALSLTFSDFEIVSQGSGNAGMLTKLFTLVLPLVGDGTKAKVLFSAGGHVLTNPGASAVMMMSVNGQTEVKAFGSVPDQGFSQDMTVTADAATACRLCVFLLVSQEGGGADNAAQLTVTNIEVGIQAG